MKHLFVTHNTQIKKKPERQDIFLCCERKEEKNDNIENSPSISTTHLNNSLNTINSSSSTTTNSSIDSRKVSYNIITPDTQTISNTNYSVNSNINTNSANYNKFLGKKSKIHFDIIKNEETKQIHFNIFNNSNSNSNSQSIDDTITNKDIENNENESLELIEEKNDTINYITDSNNIKMYKYKEKINFMNAGRWSFPEHIKFIEAIAEYGKNWKDVQKYVGSRSSAQARSHAQKFFLKLKTLKNPKFNFDFSNKNIKNLSDIINIIKKREEYTIQGKEYIINTLITLSKSITCENFYSNKSIKKNFKNEKEIEFKNDTKKEESPITNNKELKLDLFNVFNDNINNNFNDIKTDKTYKSKSKQNINKNNKNKDKDKEIITNFFEKLETQYLNNQTEIEKINEEKKNVDNNKDNNKDNNNDNNNVNNKEKEKNVSEEKKNLNNNNEDKNAEDLKTKSDIGVCDNKYMEKNQQFIFDDDTLFIINDSEFFNLNNISLKLKEYNYIKSFESPNILYNKSFFS